MDSIKLKAYETNSFKAKSIDTQTVKTTLQTTVFEPSLDFRVIENSMYIALLIRRLWR